MSGTTDRRPPKRDLKATILWCSRWLLEEDGKPYRGKNLTVRVGAEGQGEAIEVKPVRGNDGVDVPVMVRLAEEPAGQEVSAPELLRVLFSADELSILRAMAGREASKASDVMERAKLEKSKFWVLWSNLQHRGVVGDVEQGEGFCVLPQWVKEMFAGNGQNRPAA